MFYVGIDIAKKNHQVGIIDETGNPISKTLNFSNSEPGFQKLLVFLTKSEVNTENSLIAMEATGH